MNKLLLTHTSQNITHAYDEEDPGGRGWFWERVRPHSSVASPFRKNLQERENHAQSCTSCTHSAEKNRLEADDKIRGTVTIWAAKGLEARRGHASSLEKNEAVDREGKLQDLSLGEHRPRLEKQNETQGSALKSNYISTTAREMRGKTPIPPSVHSSACWLNITSWSIMCFCLIHPLKQHFCERSHAKNVQMTCCSLRLCSLKNNIFGGVLFQTLKHFF